MAKLYKAVSVLDPQPRQCKVPIQMHDGTRIPLVIELTHQLEESPIVLS